MKSIADASRQLMVPEKAARKESRADLHPLTAFRFFAAFAVFGRHLFKSFTEIPDVPSAFLVFLRDGAAGVAFFFVLSGFILTYNYRSTFTSLTFASAKKFYVARLARIGPVHVLTFLLFLPLVYHQVLAEPAIWLGRAIANVTFTQSFVPLEPYYFSYNSVSWSLSDELFFYGCLPLILWGMHAAGWEGPRRAIAVAIVSWLIAMSCILLWQNHPKAIWLWYINPPFRLLDFLIGVALCQVFLGMRDGRIAVLDWKWATLLEAASLASLAVSLAFSDRVPFLLRRGVYYIPCFVAMIFAFAFQRGLLSRLLSMKLFRYLGEASFSFYMFHFMAIGIAARFPRTLHLDGAKPLTQILVVFSISLSVSLCCWRWFEMPLRDRVKNWLLRSGRKQTADALPLARELSVPRKMAG